jgi:hypothetical protein
MKPSDINNIGVLYESCKLKEFIPLDNIAKKHKVSDDVVKKALSKGTKVEMEHTKDKKTAEAVASHHLFELIDYYDKLEKIEKK